VEFIVPDLAFVVLSLVFSEIGTSALNLIHVEVTNVNALLAMHIERHNRNILVSSFPFFKEPNLAFTMMCIVLHLAKVALIFALRVILICFTPLDFCITSNNAIFKFVRSVNGTINLGLLSFAPNHVS